MINPLSNDLKVMRQSMLFGGLETISYNINRKNNSLKLFEFGKTYHSYDNEFQEQKHLSLLVSGNRHRESWSIHHKTSDFFYLKGIVTTIFDRLGLSNLKITPTKSAIFLEGITLSLGKHQLVDLGVINTKITREYSIKQEVLYADFNWDKILSLKGKKKVSVSELPKFPSVKRDLALLLDKNVTFKEIYNLSFQSERKLLKEVDLFDVYQGENLPEGKKSYAVSFVLQDEHKTLADKQIDKIMQKLQHTFEKNLQAVLR